MTSLSYQCNWTKIIFYNLFLHSTYFCTALTLPPDGKGRNQNAEYALHCETFRVQEFSFPFTYEVAMARRNKIPPRRILPAGQPTELDFEIVLVDHGGVIQPDLSVWETFDALLLAHVMRIVDLFCQSTEMLVLKVTSQASRVAISIEDGKCAGRCLRRRRCIGRSGRRDRVHVKYLPTSRRRMDSAVLVSVPSRSISPSYLDQSSFGPRLGGSRSSHKTARSFTTCIRRDSPSAPVKSKDGTTEKKNFR